MDQYQAILKQYWGYDDFRGIQRQIIQSIISGKDTLGLMPTGGGKSITFQVPALAADGLCLVITPLIALMRDQVDNLVKRGIKAAAIHSGMARDKILTTLDNAVFGAYKLLYISPERIGTDLFQTKLAHMKVSFICVDEAHCISQWGYDFRPSYLNICSIRKLLPNAPILALTATATPEVAADIQKLLSFRQPCVFSMSFERKNLAYIVQKEDNKDVRLKNILRKYEGSTIIYCRNRDNCKILAEALTEWGFTATFYHAGLLSTEKDKRQKQWQQDKYRVMVATNAFGMGIDKPNVRLVIHYDLPDSIEAYFQEAGRAGRDGLPSKAILLYNNRDLTNLRRQTDESYPPIETICQIYEEVCCFLHIAIGFGQGIRREFNLQKFCVAFHHFPTLVNSCLEILTHAGYINYTDAEEGTSRLKFILRRDELYRIHSNDVAKDNIMRSLFRNYYCLFVNYVAIDEDLLAHECGLTPSEVYHHLKELNDRRILEYIPKKNIPHITFVTERREIRHLSFPAHVYKDRKESTQRRTDSLIHYITQDETCRNRLLLDYFGEKTSEPCHHCDVCTSIEGEETTEGNSQQVSQDSNQQTNHQLITDRQQIKQAILVQIRQAGALYPFELDFDQFDLDTARDVLRELSNYNEIATNEVFQIYVNE